MVLAAHTAIVQPFWGWDAVLLFFTLSAFLLTQPLLKGMSQPLAETLAFYVRRIFRIYPMFVLFVVVDGLIFKPVSPTFIFDSLVLYRGWIHLWSISHELLFYLIMPLIVLALTPLMAHPVVVSVLLLLSAGAAHLWLTSAVLNVPKYPEAHPLYLAPFLVGMAAAFVAPIVRQLSRAWPRLVFEIVNALIVAAIFYDVSHFCGALRSGLIFGALLLSVSCAPPETVLNRLLSFYPLRIVGLMGFSFYLWHWLPATMLPLEWPAALRFLTAFAITTGISAVSSVLIEVPFIDLGAKIARKIHMIPFT